MTDRIPSHASDAERLREAAPAGGRPLRAILFDLDGTLLPMDLHEFLSGYFALLARCATDAGMDGRALADAVTRAVGSMMEPHPGLTNEEAFWKAFDGIWGADESVRGFLERFYERDFDELGRGMEPNPQAVEAVALLRAKGYPLALATMPLYPRIAVEARIRWAGLDPSDFALITSYDRVHAVKPTREYFAEVLGALGVRPDEVIMVGNDTTDDLGCRDSGIDAFMVTDCLIDRAQVDLSTVLNGSMADFLDFVRSLPDCER